MDEALKRVGMYEFRNNAPHLLSGGQKQRVAIAGVLAMQPEILVMDEPTAMLDPSGRQEVLRTIADLRAATGVTVVLITHHMDECIDADRLLVVSDGKLVLDGAPKDVFSRVEQMRSIGLESLRCVYSAGTPFEKVALDNIDLSIPAGQYAALLGHTGSGKSTLIQHLNGLLKPAAGRVLLGEEDIHSSKEALRAVRFRVGLVFQYPEYQLFEETVYRDIAFGPKNMGLNEQEVDEHVRFGAKFAGVDESLFEASPLDLSGGQKRRIAIAGVMAMKPEVLVLDEPMAGLDPAGCREILANIAEYHRSTGSTVVLVTHDMDVAAENAERLIVMRRGKIALDGAPEEIFTHAAELREMGLGIPGAAALAEELRARGAAVPQGIYTPHDLAAALLAGKEGGAC